MAIHLDEESLSYFIDSVMGSLTPLQVIEHVTNALRKKLHAQYPKVSGVAIEALLMLYKQHSINLVERQGSNPNDRYSIADPFDDELDKQETETRAKEMLDLIHFTLRKMSSNA